MDINKIEQPKNRRQQAISAKADPVEVFCRVRPMNDSDESCLRILDDSTLMLTIPEVLISFSYSSIYLSFQHSFLLFSITVFVCLQIGTDQTGMFIFICFQSSFFCGSIKSVCLFDSWSIRSLKSLTNRLLRVRSTKTWRNLSFRTLSMEKTVFCLHMV